MLYKNSSFLLWQKAGNSVLHDSPSANLDQCSHDTLLYNMMDIQCNVLIYFQLLLITSSVLCVLTFKLIPVLCPVDIHFVNCAWLVYGKIMRNLVQCVRSHGKYFLLSVMITGKEETTIILCYASITSLAHRFTLEQILRVLMVNKLLN